MKTERETSLLKQINNECKYNILNFNDKKDPKISHLNIEKSNNRDLKSLTSGSPYNIIN